MILLVHKPPAPKLGAFGNEKVKKRALDAFEKGDKAALVSTPEDPEASIKTISLAPPLPKLPEVQSPIVQVPPLASPIPQGQASGLPGSQGLRGHIMNPEQQALEDAIKANDPVAAEVAIKAGADVNFETIFNANWQPGWNFRMRIVMERGTPLKQALHYGHNEVAAMIRKMGGHE